MAAQVSYLGNGKIFIGPYGGGSAIRDIGQVHDFKLEVTNDVKELRDMQGSGGVVDQYTLIKSVTASFTLRSFSAENLKMALYAGSSAITAAQETIAMPGFKGGLIPFNAAGMESLVVKTGTTDTLTLLSDYTVEPAGVYILETPTSSLVGRGTTDTVTIIGTRAAGTLIQGLTDTLTEYKIVASLKNKVDDDKGYVVTLHRVRFSPVKELAMLSDDFISLNMTAEVLQDQTISGAGLSQYLTIMKET